AEGTAALVARSLVDAGAADRSSEDVRNALFPTGNAFEVVVEREWASIRLRDDAIREVTDGLSSDEEVLGREVLEASIYQGHPYGHPPEGRAGVLPLI